MANRTEQIEWNIGKNDELSVIRAAQQGDSEALERLLREYTRLVRAQAHICTLQGTDIEDGIQEGMLALLSAVEHFNPERGVPFSSYARICVERRLHSVVRSAAARKHEPLSQAVSLDKPLAEDPCSCISCTSNPETLIIGQEEHRETLTRLFDLLSHFESQVLQLYLYGLSYDEIAVRMAKTRKSVANAMQRIHRKAERL